LIGGRRKRRRRRRRRRGNVIGGDLDGDLESLAQLGAISFIRISPDAIIRAGCHSNSSKVECC